MLSAPLPWFTVVRANLAITVREFKQNELRQKKVNYLKISLDKGKPSVDSRALYEERSICLFGNLNAKFGNKFTV